MYYFSVELNYNLLQMMIHFFYVNNAKNVTLVPPNFKTIIMFYFNCISIGERIIDIQKNEMSLPTISNYSLIYWR